MGCKRDTNGKKKTEIERKSGKYCTYSHWYRKVLYLIPEGPYMNLVWDLLQF